jgi:hypothetical protein
MGSRKKPRKNKQNLLSYKAADYKQTLNRFSHRIFLRFFSTSQLVKFIYLQQRSRRTGFGLCLLIHKTIFLISQLL